MKIYRLAKNEHIKLYRGLSKNDANKLRSAGFIPITKHPGNQLTDDITTAQTYADEVDEGIVIEMEIDRDCVLEDSIYKGDFRIIKPAKIYGIKRVV